MRASNGHDAQIHDRSMAVSIPSELPDSMRQSFTAAWTLGKGSFGVVDECSGGYHLVLDALTHAYTNASLLGFRSQIFDTTWSCYFNTWYLRHMHEFLEDRSAPFETTALQPPLACSTCSLKSQESCGTGQARPGQGPAGWGQTGTL